MVVDLAALRELLTGSPLPAAGGERLGPCGLRGDVIDPSMAKADTVPALASTAAGGKEVDPAAVQAWKEKSTQLCSAIAAAREPGCEAAVGALLEQQRVLGPVPTPPPQELSAWAKAQRARRQAAKLARQLSASEVALDVAAEAAQGAARVLSAAEEKTASLKERLGGPRRRSRGRLCSPGCTVGEAACGRPTWTADDGGDGA